MTDFVDEAMRLAATARRESEWGFPDAPVVWDELRAHLEAREAQWEREWAQADLLNQRMALRYQSVFDKREALLKRMVEALQSVGQTLSWQCFGECRSYGESTPLLSPIDATLVALAALAAYKEAQT